MCKSCITPHPTVLHDERKSTLKVNEGSASKEVARVAQPEEATSSCTSTCNATRAIDAITNSVIVPIRVHHRTNPERQVVVYALLDPGSNGTFIKESILEDLQVDGTETQLQLNTMHGSEVVPNRRITGLNVESMGKDARVELPKTYTRDDIPTKREEIPRPETAKVWPHLSGIASKLYLYQVDVEVGLLIGSNCPSAIKPEEVIPWRSSDPYAILTLLGWGIIGPVKGGSNKENSDVLCHRVAVKEIGSKEPSSHSFVIESYTKEIISPVAVKRMF